MGSRACTRSRLLGTVVTPQVISRRLAETQVEAEADRDSSRGGSPLIADTFRRQATDVLQQALPELVVMMTNTIICHIVASSLDGFNVQTEGGLSGPLTQRTLLSTPALRLPELGSTPVTPNVEDPLTSACRAPS